MTSRSFSRSLTDAKHLEQRVRALEEQTAQCLILLFAQSLMQVLHTFALVPCAVTVGWRFAIRHGVCGSRMNGPVTFWVDADGNGVIFSEPRGWG